MTDRHYNPSSDAAPPIVRRLVVAVTGALLAGALYLVLVRGDAILADLSALGSKAWCF